MTSHDMLGTVENEGPQHITWEERDRLVLEQRSMGFVFVVWRKHRGNPLFSLMSTEDIEGYGMIGLLTAANKYDPSRGLKFSTYAYHWVRHWLGYGAARVPVVKPPGWAFGITSLANHVVTKEERDQIRAALGASSAELHDSFAPSKNTEEPINEVIGSEKQRIVREALDTLPATQRRVLTLHFFQGYDIRGIASFLGMSPQKVKNVMKQGIYRLRKYFGVGEEPDKRTDHERYDYCIQ